MDMTELSWDDNFPGFTLVAETITVLNTEHNGEAILVPSSDIDIEPYDIIGIQHNASLSPIQCRPDAQSEWRNRIIKAYGSNWIHQLSRPDFPASANWQENIVCEIEAIYNIPETVKAPANLVKPYALKTGEYIFTANVFNSVSNQSVSSGVIMLYTVHGFDLILPNNVPNKPVSTLNNKLAVEANVTSDFLWKISKGTQVMGTWNLTSGSFTFTGECPEQFNSLDGCQNKNLQFVHVTHLFPFIGEENVVSLFFNASNTISSAQISYDIVAQIPVENLTLTLPEPLMFRANNSLLLSAKINTGSHVTYTWELDGNDFTTDTGQTGYTFPAAGYYEVQVAAANGLGSLNSQGTVTLIAEANLGNLQIHVPNVVIAGNTATILASVEINRYCMVSFYFDHGDGSSLQREDRVESLRSTTVANEAVQKSYNLAENEGVNEVTITVIVVDNLYWNKTITPTLHDMKSEYGSIWANKTVQVVREIQNAAISLVNPATAYPSESSVEFSAEQTGGTGTMYYNWNFGDDSEIQITLSGNTAHTFINPGVYIVSVAISNNASYALVFVSVYVEEPITNLELSYDGPTPIGQLTTLTAATRSGTAVMYQFYTGDESTFSDVQTASSYSHQYGSVDGFNATVRAFNNVSESSSSIWVYTMNEETLIVTGIESDECVAMNEEALFKALVVHMDPQSLNYIWQFGNILLSGASLMEVNHAFEERGTFTVSVTAWELDIGQNTPLNRSDTSYSSVCVQERIAGIELVTNSPLAIRGGVSMEVQLVINLTIEAGSDYISKWIYGDTKESGLVTFVPTITYTSVGHHEIKLVVENKIGKEVVVTEIDVQEIIEAPSISYNASSRYLSTKENYKFTPHIEYGTSVSYRWDIYAAQNASSVQTFGTETVTAQLSEVKTCIVTLTASNNVSNATVSLELHFQDPVMNLEVSSSSTIVLVGGFVEFVSEIEGSSVSYNWTVCQENSCQGVLSATNVTRFVQSFSTAGSFNIKVLASNEISSEMSEVAVAVIAPVQNASILVVNPVLIEDHYVFRGTEVTLIGTVAQGNEVSSSWKINAPGGELIQLEGSTITFEFEEAGLYTFQLNMSNVFNQETVEYEIESVQPITEVNLVSINGTRGNLGGVMKFQADLENPVAPETVYRWTIKKVGSDSEITFEETEGKITHVFNEYGAYNVSVEVLNVMSRAGDDVTITIAEQIGMVEILVNGQSSYYVRKGQTVLFRGLLEQGTSTSFDWLFTDSIPPKVYITQEVSHVFHTIGKFKIKLNVSNSVSFTNVGFTIYSEEVISNLSIGVNGTLTPLSNPLVFVANVDKGSNLTYAWDFGEGDGLIEESNRTVLHKFSSTGVFTVKANVSNDLSSAEKTVQITVQDKIKGLELFNCCDQILSSGTLFWFEAQVSAGSDVNYTWIIEEPNGNTFKRNEEKFSYLLQNPGVYSIGLKASNQVGTACVKADLIVQEEIRGLKIEGPDKVYDGHYGLYQAETEEGTNIRYEWKVNFIPETNAVEKTFRHFFTIEDAILTLVHLHVEAYNNVSRRRDSKLVHIKLLDCVSPELIPIGGANRSELRSHAIHMETRIVSNCTRYPVTYTWEVYKAECFNVRDDTAVAHLIGVDKKHAEHGYSSQTP